MAISAVTVPRSLPHNTECAADKAGEHCLDWSALENESEQTGETSGGNSGDGVLGGCGAVFAVIGREKCGVCVHASIFQFSADRTREEL